MDKKVPASISVECAECGEETLHRTLKGQVSKKDMKLLLKCAKCGHVRNETFALPNQVSLRLIISRGGQSERTSTELSSDWTLEVGEELMHGDERLLVTGLDSGGKRVNSARADKTETIWAKNFDNVKLRFSVNRRGRTRAFEIIVDPEEEFEVGSEIEIDDKPVHIHSIRTTERTIRRGTANARDIVRVYCTDARKGKGKRST
jgi:uncharacterized Zn finger protein